MTQKQSSEARKIASRENGKKGGRPATGQTKLTAVYMPAAWVERLDAVRGSTSRGRWIMEHLEHVLTDATQD